MNRVPKTLLTIAYLALLAACAGSETVERRYAPVASEDPQPLQCGPGRVAVCIEAHCDPSEYVCTDQGDLRGLFETRRHQ